MDSANVGQSEWSKDASADFLGLDLTAARPGARAGWLADRLQEAIADGRLPVGARLPATRALAEELGTSRGLVVEAYRRLAETGQVAGRGRSGTVVVAAPQRAAEPAVSATRPVPVTFADPGLAVFDDIRAAPAGIDLTPGRPDLASFPRGAWLRAERRVLSDLPPERLGYADPAGVPEFRAAVATWLGRFRGIRVEPDAIVVVAGVAQGLALLARVLLARGIDTIAVEDPGSFGARRHLENWGLTTVPVPVDEAGLRVDALRRTGASVVLVTPAHQFPTGVVLGAERRRELAAWIEEGGLVVEDDYDAEHRYDRSPVAALRSGDARICYAGSLSKTLAPALRVGWLVPPPDLLAAVVDAKRDVDLGNPTLPQLVLTQLLDGGDLERHLRAVRRRHRRRRDAMVEAISRDLPGARIHGAAAGLHLVVTFEGPTASDVAVAEQALGLGVKVQPLSWHRTEPGPPGLVLGYAACSPNEIGAGLEVLGGLVRTNSRQP